MLYSLHTHEKGLIMIKYRDKKEKRIAPLIGDLSGVRVGKVAIFINLEIPVTLQRCKDLCSKFNQKTISIVDSRYFDDNGNEYTDKYLLKYDETGYVLKKTEYHYNRAKNRLVIWKNDAPIYENDNGRICRDIDALADSLM